jgi:hypothetical protein
VFSGQKYSHQDVKTRAAARDILISVSVAKGGSGCAETWV